MFSAHARLSSLRLQLNVNKQTNFIQLVSLMMSAGNADKVVERKKKRKGKLRFSAIITGAS